MYEMLDKERTNTRELSLSWSLPSIATIQKSMSGNLKAPKKLAGFCIILSLHLFFSLYCFNFALQFPIVILVAFLNCRYNIGCFMIIVTSLVNSDDVLSSACFDLNLFLRKVVTQLAYEIFLNQSILCTEHRAFSTLRGNYFQYVYRAHISNLTCQALG